MVTAQIVKLNNKTAHIFNFVKLNMQNLFRNTPQLLKSSKVDDPSRYIAWPIVWKQLEPPKYLRRCTCLTRHRHRNCHPKVQELATSKELHWGNTWPLGEVNRRQKWDQYTLEFAVDVLIYLLFGANSLDTDNHRLSKKWRMNSFGILRHTSTSLWQLLTIQATRGPNERDPSALQFLRRPTYARLALHIFELASWLLLTGKCLRKHDLLYFHQHYKLPTAQTYSKYKMQNLILKK